MTNPIDQFISRAKPATKGKRIPGQLYACGNPPPGAPVILLPEPFGDADLWLAHAEFMRREVWDLPPFEHQRTGFEKPEPDPLIFSIDTAGPNKGPQGGVVRKTAGVGFDSGFRPLSRG